MDHATQVGGITERAAQEGWPPIHEADWFGDTDLSASKEDVDRPGWRALLALVKATDRRTTKLIVIAYAQDRMIRQLADLSPTADLIELKKGELWSVKAGHINTTKSGREAFYFSGMMNTTESEKTAVRSNDGISTAARNGLPHGPVGYGWRRVYTADGPGRPKGRNVIDHQQKAVVVEVADRVISGGSLHSIARNLTERGVLAPGAGQVRRRDPVTKEPLAVASGAWNPTKLRQLLLRKSNIGIRTHRAKDSAEDGGLVREYPADWEPLLDEATYAQVVATLTAPDRRGIVSNVARHLLSNIAVCAVCGVRLTAQKNTKPDGSTSCVYRCPRSTHVSKSETRTDELVTEAVLALTADKDIRKALLRSDGGATREAVERAARLRRKLRETKDRYTKTDDITLDEWVEMKADLEAQLKEAKAVIDRRQDAAVYADLFNADDPRAEWERTLIDRRRAIVKTVFDIVVWPSSRRGKAAFDPETIDIAPRIPG